jgi:hypothetical protein
MPIGIYPRKSLTERFWAKVIKTDSCWLWQGYRHKVTGYGQIQINGRPELVHILSYKLAGRNIPNGMELDHLCRNRICVNPDHLEPVTHRDNVLRGINACAKNARVIHCPKGHPYDLLNTYHRPDGGRDCKICQKERSRIYKSKGVRT